ncbi:MAG: hypothetical protein FJ264_12910 [Planctomycetes bacterium]|nr:hypothetical protein [Planctomycetota bacterium]
MAKSVEKKHTFYAKLINLRVRILVPLSLSLICILGVFVFSIYKYYHKNIADCIEDAIPSVHNLMLSDIEGDAGLMKGVLEALKGNKKLQRALRNKDRRALLRHTMPLFNTKLHSYIN